MKGKKYEKGKLIFKGEFKEGKEWTGNIKEYDYYDDLEFEGNYLYGEKHGYGKEYYHKKLKFEGEYYYDYKWKWKYYKYFYSEEGIENEYEYLYGEKNGKAIEYYKGGKIKFEGEYLNDEKWQGKGYDPNGEIIYEIKNGKKIGEAHDDGDYEWIRN